MEVTLSPTMVMILGLAAPMTSGLICLFVVAAYRYQNPEPNVRRITKVLLAELAVCVFCWFSLICYWGATYIFVYIHSLFLLSLFYAQVFTYRFIFLHTSTRQEEQFSVLHYLFPIVPSVMLFVCMFIYPQPVREYIVSVRPPLTSQYLFYNVLTQSVPFMFLAANICYSSLGLRRIILYRRVVGNYSADESRSSLGWLKLLIFVAISSLPLALIPSVMGIGVTISLMLIITGMFAIVLKDVILIHNTMIRNYVLIYPLTEKNAEDEDVTDEKKLPIAADAFEQYMQLKKPFLDPELRITDLTQAFHTNRTYMSAFINNQYGMNFSRYINRLRLEELESIRMLPENAHLNRAELVLKVGFSSYRGYWRFKKEEERRSMVRGDKEHHLS